ncbi:MAG: right-handed parallel beta-helix repeat-containing protein, partial [Chitinispirillaceae bacterium]
MKKILAILALLIGTNLVYASSIRVAENVTRNTTWAADTVFVDDAITVSSGVTLTIAPGTNVIFGRRRYLDILGVLHAVGTETDSIVFRGDMAEDYQSWDGLKFNDGRRADGVQDTSKFVYARIMSAINHSSYRPYRAPIYLGVNTKLKILHSEIKYLYGDYGGAIFCDTASSLVIDHSVIEKCETRIGGGGAVYASLESVNLQIRNSVFRENEARYGGALYLGGGMTATIDNCVFWRNVFENPNYNDEWWGGGAVMISSSNVTMRNSLIARNSTSARGGGIAILGSSPRLINLTIARNTGYRGCGVYIRNTASRVSSPEIINTAIASNGPSVGGLGSDTIGKAIYFDTEATAKIRYSLLDNTPVQAAGGPVTGDFENL